MDRPNPRAPMPAISTGIQGEPPRGPPPVAGSADTGCGVGLPVGLAEALALGVAVALGPVTVVSPQSVGAVIRLLIKVTMPFRAKARPSILAASLSEMSVRAMMVPTNVVVVSSVAELLTCQKTLQGCAPLMRTTLAPGAVTRVLPI